MSKLYNLSTLDFNQIELSATESKSIPGQKLSYQRVRIGIRNGNELNDLLIQSAPSLLAWGLRESRDLCTQELNGYEIPIVLWTNRGTKEEKAFTDGFHDLCEHLKKMLIDRKDTSGKYDLELSDMKRLNPFHWKTDKGQIVDETRGPTFYGKCLFDRQSHKINTIFVNEATKQFVNPKKLIKKHMYISFVLRVEGVFIGNRLSLQMRITEVLYREKENNRKSLLCPEAKMEEYDASSDEYCESDHDENFKSVPVLPVLKGDFSVAKDCQV